MDSKLIYRISFMKFKFLNLNHKNKLKPFSDFEIFCKICLTSYSVDLIYIDLINNELKYIFILWIRDN